MFGSCFVMLLFIIYLQLYNHLNEEERTDYFTLVVFLLLCGCLCLVSLPRSTMGLYSLLFAFQCD